MLELVTRHMTYIGFSLTALIFFLIVQIWYLIQQDTSRNKLHNQWADRVLVLSIIGEAIAAFIIIRSMIILG